MSGRFEEPHSGIEPEEPPPFLKTWRRVYLALLLYLALLITLFYVFTQTSSA